MKIKNKDKVEQCRIYSMNIFRHFVYRNTNLTRGMYIKISSIFRDFMDLKSIFGKDTRN